MPLWGKALLSRRRRKAGLSLSRNPGMDGYESALASGRPATAKFPSSFSQARPASKTKLAALKWSGRLRPQAFLPTFKARVRSPLLREARAQLADQLLALNNELEMACQIQLSILPHSLPKLPGLDIAARFIPMTSVAGDFYDFIQIDDTHLGMLIADVSGHGLPSALIASMLQVALTAQVGHASEPARVLCGLNHALCGKFTHDFVTAVYVYVDLEKNLMRYAGAGHPPVLQWRSSTGKTTQVMENGLVLGMFEEAVYTALELALEPGDRHILYTDGILEAANPAQETYGVDRFIEFMNVNNSLPADQFADTFLAEITNWTRQSADHGQQDDITLLLFDFKRP